MTDCETFMYGFKVGAKIMMDVLTEGQMKEKKEHTREKTKKDKCDNNVTDNQIGDEGARMISESLRINTTLTKLNLSDEKMRMK